MDILHLFATFQTKKKLIDMAKNSSGLARYREFLLTHLKTFKFVCDDEFKIIILALCVEVITKVECVLCTCMFF